MGGGGHVFFAKLPYIFIKKILFSYIIFVKSGSTACYLYLWYSLFQAQWDICNQQNHQGCHYMYLVKGHHYIAECEIKGSG